MDAWKFDKAKDLHLPPRERHRSLIRESGLVESGLRLAWWSSVRAALKIFHRISFRGQEHLAQPSSFIIAANHQSHLDALVIGAGLPLRMRDQVFPLAAGDVFFEVPMVAAFSALAINALPVWRKNCGKQELQVLRKRLSDENCHYILFPEGTRTRSGDMGSFRSGIGMLVAETTVPVIPCLIKGTYLAFPPDKRFPRPKKVSVAFGSALTFSNTPNNRTGWDEIAHCTELAVRGLATSSVK